MDRPHAHRRRSGGDFCLTRDAAREPNPRGGVCTMNYRHRLAAAAVVLLVAGSAFAKVALNTIDPTPVVTDGGRQLIVTGPIPRTAGERTPLAVTVTQRSTGAIAQGSTRVICRGEGQIQQWEVHATAQ